jgi:Heme exporter protein D (CcmD)
MLAMTYAGYVATGWIGSAVVLGGYAVHLVRRGRKLSRQVPSEQRRWS